MDRFRELSANLTPQEFLTCVECLHAVIKGLKPSLLSVIQLLTQGSKKHFRVSQLDLLKVKPISELAIFAPCFDLVLKNANELAI